MENNRFIVTKLSEAAYLEGVHGIKCLGLELDPDNRDRALFIFNLSSEEGSRLIMAFGSSESFRFDNSVKNFKGKLFHKLKEKKSI